MIVYLRLVDGTELIGETESSWDDEVINVEDPMVLVKNEVLVEFMSHATESLFTLRRRDVIVFTTPDKYLASKWLEKHELI